MFFRKKTTKNIIEKVLPRSDDWPESLHPQHGFSYSGRPETEGCSERHSQELLLHFTVMTTSEWTLRETSAQRCSNSLLLSSQWLRAGRRTLIWYTCPVTIWKRKIKQHFKANLTQWNSERRQGQRVCETVAFSRTWIWVYLHYFICFFFKQSKSPRPRFHFSNTGSTFWIDVR